MTEAPVQHLPGSSKVFEVTSDASHVRIRGILSQESNLIHYLLVKVNEAKQNYFIYDKEFYDLVKAIH